MSSASINKKAILKYVSLPGIRPRFVDLFGRGFHYIPYFIALVYECVRLLPKGHPYLNSNNIGRFGIRHVIAEAANNLVLDKKNIDQIAVFFLIIIGMIIVCVQIVLVFIALFMQPTMAAFPANYSEFFVPGAYGGVGTEQDLALILLDMVFGVPEMFGSCVDQVVNPGAFCESNSGQPIEMSPDLVAVLSSPGPNTPSFTHWAVWPYPIHEGLHQLFAVYSYGLLIIAVFITIYFMITVIAETAQTGTAFGKRFNKVWAPIRIVVAFGLLIPITLGMNSGQFIVLYAAKFGSGFASNGWAYFNTSFSDHYLENWKELVSVPNMPELGGLAQFFMAAATCKSAYTQLYANTATPWTENAASDYHIVPYVIRETNTIGGNAYALSDPGGDIPAFGATVAQDPYEDFMNVGNFSYKSNRMIIRFGRQSREDYRDYLGYVKPICGEIVLNLEDSREPGAAEPGAEVMQRFYWWLIKQLWWSEGRLEPFVGTQRYSESYAKKEIGALDFDPTTDLLPEEINRRYMMERLAIHMNEALTGTGGPDSGGLGNAVDAERASTEWNLTPELMEKGWAGASLWYSKVAQMNGAVTSATFNVPVPSLYPWLMEYTAGKQKEHNQNTTVDNRFNPVLADGVPVHYPSEQQGEMARAMYEAYSFWADAAGGASTQIEPTGNIIKDGINYLFGTEGLFDMRKNLDVHPLAQLVGIGRSLVESSIRNIGFAAVGGGAAAITQTLGAFGMSALAGTASSFLISIAMVGLTAGFILYYIVPFLPFIYFFFAVGGWVKGIFEAMVGVPLWALAHIRIDGEGLSGQAALNGYFLIFEIFLRPILIIFGFLASILIFSALVEVLNDIFDMVVANLGGFDVNEEAFDSAGTGISYIEYYRSAVDEFFFTVIYAVVVYMIGMSCFKLIDQIPNNILRWMNQNVATFNDSREDPAQGLVGTAQMGAQQGLNSMGGGLEKMISSVSGPR